MESRKFLLFTEIVTMQTISNNFYTHLTRASSIELVRACPMWRMPVTLGGGITIQ